MHDDANKDTESRRHKTAGKQRRISRLIAVLVGVSALAALVLFIANSGDITAFARQAANASAGPLAAALAVQTLPYLFAAYVWFLFLKSMGSELKLRSLIPLSLAKLFADQALPSGGLSGAAFFLFALTKRGVPDKTAFRTFVFTTSAYFLAFLVTAIISLIALSTAEKAPPALSASVSAFAGVFLLATIITGLVVLYKPERAPPFIRKHRLTAKAAEFLGAAIHDIRTMPALFAKMTAILIAVRAIDGLTLMLISHAIGAPIAYTTGFIAVATASIAATIGPVPMGLGTFEAGMIASLNVFGASMEDALTITLIYRGLTLWLPLLPGFLIIQREFLNQPSDNNTGRQQRKPSAS